MTISAHFILLIYSIIEYLYFFSAISLPFLWIPFVKLPLSLSSPQSTIQKVLFSPNGHFLASAGEDSSVMLWGLRHSNLIAELKGHTECVYSLSFCRDGNVLASGERGVLPLSSKLSFYEETGNFRGFKECIGGFKEIKDSEVPQLAVVIMRFQFKFKEIVDFGVYWRDWDLWIHCNRYPSVFPKSWHHFPLQAG